MEINNKFFKGARGVRTVITGVIFALAGSLFVGLGIYFLFKPLTNEQGQSSNVISYFFIGLGAIAAIVGVISIIVGVKSLKQMKPLTIEQVEANEALLNQGEPTFDNLKDTKLFFHFGGKLNQSFFVENQAGEKKYECILRKFSPVGSDTFEFRDVDHNYSKNIKVSKTLTTSSNGGMLVGDVLTSRIKIDGVGCWDYLYQRGYEIKHHIFVHPLEKFELYKVGKLVASIVPCNVKDPFNEESKNILRMGRGAYRLEIIDCKLADAVMVAFIIAKTEITE